GLVSKYAGLFLKSLFHSADNPNKSNVYMVKGVITAEFRRMWGLQGEYEKKSRLNHCHHCIDAITIACIGKAEYDKMAQYYHDEEVSRWHGSAGKPHFKKPWPTFTEDVLALEQSLLIKHLTKDNMPKQAKRRVRTAKGKHLAQGDAARGSLHKDTYYGAIEQEGEIRYVLRKSLSDFNSETELENIVDQAVKEKIKAAVAGKNFKAAIAEPIFMNKEKGIRINKVRCYADSVKNPLHIRQQRDLSDKEYKQQFHVVNDSNYMLAIYEGEVKGKVKRDFALVNNITAASFFKRSNRRKNAETLVPKTSPKGNLPLLVMLKIGMQVLLYEKSSEEIKFDSPHDLVKRLYKVVGLSIDGSYIMIDLRYNQEARQAKDVKPKKGAYMENEQFRPCIRLRHTQFKALVEGIDFEFNILGEIKKKEHHA
ncbi:MAG: CRISPR-associated protein Csn1, partial [Prevotella sp.]